MHCVGEYVKLVALELRGVFRTEETKDNSVGVVINGGDNLSWSAVCLEGREKFPDRRETCCETTIAEIRLTKLLIYVVV